MKRTTLCAAFFVAVVLSIAPAPAHGQSKSSETGSDQPAGTANYIPVWTGAKSAGDSIMYQAGRKAIGIGTTSPSAMLDVENSSTTGASVLGDSFATTGNTTGVLGSVVSPTGVAVQGYAGSTTGNTTGGLFQVVSGTGIGVYGLNTGTSGYAIGVYGQVSSSSGSGVTGSSIGATGNGSGVLGQSNADDGVGVVAHATATSGYPQAFYGDTDSPSGSGVVALLRSQAGSDIIIGQFGVGLAAMNVFRVDSTGKGFFDGGEQTGGADFAESVAVAKGINVYQPGDLLIVDASADRQLTLASEPYSTLVAGIYSTKPGVLGTTHKMAEKVTNEIPMAIVGIVPCKVTTENGPIARGDLLVTSSAPGYAMRGTDRSRMLGAVVGKALEPLSEGKGVIQVLLTLQ
jgi:hypothetical protein